MIRGVVTSDRQAMIRLTLRAASGQEQAIEATVDTGFNGWLSLPPRLIASLGFPFLSRGRARVADGRAVVFNIHEGMVVWDGVARTIPVDEADISPIVGMALLYGHDLHVRVIDGGVVTIEPVDASSTE